jgi:putative thymidine phosphorylase
MKFKARIIPISSGNRKFVVLHKEDSERYDIHRQSRLKIKHNGRELMGIAETTYSDKTVKQGEIGVFSEVSNELNLKQGTIVQVDQGEKPQSVEFIKKKLSGGILSKKEMYAIVKDIVDGSITDVELTFFVAACFSNELNSEEINYLTHALVETGKKFFLPTKPILDKHCIGGIPGNRTTMLVTPIIAAFGLTIPKTSSRSITSPAGTADTMEVLCDVNLDLKKMKKVVLKTKACLAWGGSMGIAPADEEIIRVEYPLFIDTTGLLLSSVLAKKASVGATHVLIDIPYGPQAKVKTKKRGLKLKESFENQGKKIGMKVKVVLTDGRQPVGNGVGPLLECIDVLKVLRNKKDLPVDLKEKGIYLAGELLNLSGKTKNGFKVARNLLESGKAYVKFNEIIDAQGRKELPEYAKHQETIVARKKGKIRSISNFGISKIARLCGAPRTKEAGVYLYKKVGDKVEKGESLITLYAQSEQLLKYALEEYLHLRPVKVK